MIQNIQGVDIHLQTKVSILDIEKNIKVAIQNYQLMFIYHKKLILLNDLKYI